MPRKRTTPPSPDDPTGATPSDGSGTPEPGPVLSETEGEARLVEETAERTWAALEQARAAQAVRESEGRLQLALRAAEAGQWEWDFAAGVQRWSPETFALVGVEPTPDGATPPGYATTVAPDDRARLARLLDEATARHDEHWAVEFCVAHPERGERWLATRGRFTYGPDGAPALLRGITFDVTDRKDAEAALRESEERYRLLVEAATAYAILTLDAGGTITTWGPGAVEITGWTADEAVGQPGAILFTDEDRAAGEPERERATATRDGQALDERWHVRKDGARFWGSGVLAALYGRDGALRGFVKLFRDVTEQKRDEEALRASAARDQFRTALTDALRPLETAAEAQAEAVRQLGAFLGASRALYAAVAPDGVGVTIEHDYHDGVGSVAGAHTLGAYSAGTLDAYRAGRTLVQPDVQADPALADDEKARYAGIQVGAFVAVPLVKDGRLAAVFAVHQAGPRAWTPDEVALIAETAERTWSAVARRQAEAAVRESEERFRQAVNAADLGTWVYDLDTGQTHFDARACEIFGLPDETAEPGAVEARVHPDDLPAFEAARAAALDPAGPGTFAHTHRVVRPDGSVRWVRGQAHVVFDRKGRDRRATRAVGVVADVTEAHAAEQAIRDLNATLESRVAERTRQVRELAARLTVAEQEERQRIAQVLHDDLQQQLFGLSMMLDLLRKEADGDRSLTDEAAAILQQAITTSRSLVTELSPSVLQARRLDDVLLWLADETRALHGLAVAVAVEGEPAVPDPALRVLLYQALRELLFNVVKHAGVSAARLRAWADGADVRVAVEDDGAGFQAAHAERPTGLGLSSVRERLELVGGTVEVASQPGRGTRVTLCVPAGDTLRASP